MEIILLTTIIIGALLLFVSRLLPVEATALLIIAALAITGILEPAEALSGFASNATITVAAMFVLGAALTRSGALDRLTQSLTRVCGMNLRILLLILALLVAFTSAFVTNTAIVVIMIPMLFTICRRGQITASKLFIPLSYFSILGGTATLVGTSTNILIDDLFRQAGGPGFQIFDFTAMGAIYLAIGTIVIVLLAPRLLPERTSLSALLPAERSAKFVTELVLQSDSPLIGRTVSEVLESSADVRLLELIRGEEIVLGRRSHALTLEPNDALIVEGSPKEISGFLNSVSGVELASVVEDEHRVPMRTMELKLVEAVVLPDSPFIGRLVKDLGLNRLYNVKVMAVQRHGRQHRYQIRAMKVHRGDVLLLQADDHGLAALNETGAVLIAEGVEQTVRRREKMPLAIGIMAAVVIAAALGVPLVKAAFVGAALIMVTGCLRVDEVFRSLDTSTLLLLAGTIPLGVAMNHTGLAQAIVDGIMSLVSGSPPWVILSSLYLLTAVLTSFLSNHAAAVLLTPIAYNLGLQMGVDPRSLIMAVAFGASACFATPIGYQTNAIVMGPGGYTFADYMRLGIPLNLILWIAATILIPVFWPFQPLP
ncbi:MAG: hypothetical protein GF330_10825 [Candidatus Eisenbacteria bacterium]|nr:hypothetical protein [Candidatus Eisenbacteria bacterium]